MKKYLKSVIAETKAIVWPSRKKTYQNTLIVVCALVFGGLIIALIDYGLNSLLRLIIL